MIRLTPGIECHTHEYIRTGHLDSKFGFDPNQLDEVFTWLSKQTDITTCCWTRSNLSLRNQKQVKTKVTLDQDILGRG